MSFLSQPITIQSLFGFKRKIGGLSVNVVINESTTDTLTITKQPVQQGASITDHAYMEPTTFSSTIYFSDNLTDSLKEIYTNLQDLQQGRVPFEILTPKRKYTSMLMTSLGMTTDKNTEHSLAIQLTCQQIIIVNVTTTQVPRIRQKQPAATGKTEPAGTKQSSLYTGAQAIGIR